jgi:hypothetical protein
VRLHQRPRLRAAVVAPLPRNRQHRLPSLRRRRLPHAVAARPRTSKSPLRKPRRRTRLLSLMSAPVRPSGRVAALLRLRSKRRRQQQRRRSPRRNLAPKLRHRPRPLRQSRQFRLHQSKHHSPSRPHRSRPRLSVSRLRHHRLHRHRLPHRRDRGPSCLALRVRDQSRQALHSSSLVRSLRPHPAHPQDSPARVVTSVVVVVAADDPRAPTTAVAAARRASVDR